MRVFVTGATSFIGKAVTRELLAANHTVLALARSDKSAAELAALGPAVQVQRGSLHDLDVLRDAAASADGGVVHLAFAHDPGADFIESCGVDHAAIRAMGDALAGTGRPLVVTSVTTLLAHGRLAREEDDCDPDTVFSAARAKGEDVAREYVAKGVRVRIVRLPPTNHGDGDHGFLPGMIQLAREKKVSIYVGDGLNRWPAVHFLDSATVYRLALADQSSPSGSAYHAVAEEGVRLKDVAEVIGEKLGVPVESKTKEEAEALLGPLLGMVLRFDSPASSARTKEALGWSPKHCTLLEDLENGNYF